MAVERILTKGVARSLVWDGDELVDVVGGFRRWRLDGTSTGPTIGWGFPFDQVIVSPSGRFQVLYAERATKAVLLDGGTIVRELNRSYAHAGDYDYPIALARLGDGREVVVHCPDRYNVIEIDDAGSGERLTTGVRMPMDVFHSRLSVSPSGWYLVSAGWYWHPYGIALVFDLDRALADPSTLDDRGIVPLYQSIDAEVEAVCWLDGDRLTIASSDEEPLDGGDPDAFGPGQLGVWSVAAGAWLHRLTLARAVGNLLGYGDRVLALYGHPQLIDPATGLVIAEWPDVATGVRRGSYGVTHVPSPVVALDAGSRRLAVAQPDHIAIIELPTP